MSNGKSSLAQLTIVIPSYERQAYLSRQIVFWSKYDATIELLDGSAHAHPDIQLDSLPPNIHYWHMPVSIEERFSLAINRINTEFAALLSDDEFFIPSAIQKCIAELSDDEEYVSCKGQALWFDWNGREVIGGCAYPNLKGYIIDQDQAEHRMKRHMAPYEMATLWSIQRAAVLKRSLSAMSFGPAYRTAAAGEMQTSLITAYCGKCKVIDHMMWLRSQENKNIWWSFGRQSVVDWFRDDSNADEHARFLDAMAFGLDVREDDANIRTQILSAIKAYVVDQEKKSKSQRINLRSALHRMLGKKGVNVIRSLLGKDLALTKAVNQLATDGIPVDQASIEEISLLVQDFHCDNSRR